MDSNLWIQIIIYIQGLYIVEDVKLLCISEKEQLEKGIDRIVIFVKNIAMKEQLRI